MLRTQHRFFRTLLICSDGLLILLATIIAYLVRYALVPHIGPARPDPQYATHAVPVLLGLPLILGSMIWSGLYQARRDQRFFREAVVILKAVALGMILTITATTLLTEILYEGRDLSALHWGIFGGTTFALLLTWRFCFRTALRSLRAHGWNLRHVAIIGNGRLGQIVIRTLRRNSWTGITPKFIISHRHTTQRKAMLEIPVHGGLDDLERILEEHDVSGVLIAVPGRMTGEIPSLLSRLDKFAVDVRIVPDMNPKFMPANMAVNELDGMPMLSVRESPLVGWGGVTKRALDIVGSLVALILFAVPMAVIAILIRMSGPGPVIFRQERMGLNGKRFRLFKFRTMMPATAEQQTLRDLGKGEDGWTSRNDPRITKIGRLLRRTSLDELPQLLNVLLGEMSLVGPRPERPELIARFREDWRGYMLRQSVKSGMTGWAQINGLRGQTSLRKRLQYDLFYIRNWSLMFDLRILGMTFFRGFLHPNAH